MFYSKILGTGSYLPSKLLTNEDLSHMVDTSDEWIVTRTGVKTRHIAEPAETPASMAEIAAKQALETAGIEASELGLIIVTTAAPEKFFPSTACMLHHRLSAPKTCAAFDLNAACSGVIYALSVVDQFIRSGTVKYALVVGSEMMSRIADWKDRRTCILFGDGAGAIVLGQETSPGILRCTWGADGTQEDLLSLSSGLYGPREPGLLMKGPELFKIAVEAMIHSVKEILADQHLEMSLIDWFIPHQANYRIVDLVIKKLNFPEEKVIWTIDQFANTSSSTIPLALDLAIRDGRIRRGQTLLLEAFGGGLAWGSILLKY